jgi:hypothetical protein
MIKKTLWHDSDNVNKIRRMSYSVRYIIHVKNHIFKKRFTASHQSACLLASYPVSLNITTILICSRDLTFYQKLKSSSGAHKTHPANSFLVTLTSNSIQFHKVVRHLNWITYWIFLLSYLLALLAKCNGFALLYFILFCYDELIRRPRSLTECVED